MEVEAIIGLIIAISGLASVVGGLLVKVTNFKRQVLKREDEFDDKVVWLGDQMGKTDDWVLENQEKLTTIGNVVTALSPDAKKLLQEKGADIDKMTAEINRIRDELKKIEEIKTTSIGTKTHIPKVG